jgi:RimJ/RimL family protein N-acetyltransferase
MLRFATDDDLSELLRWRNDPVTRFFRDDDRIIEPQEHMEWLHRRQKGPSCVYIFEHEEIPVGNVVLDFDQFYEVGWIVAPEWREKGIGTMMVKEILTKIPPLARVWCKTREDNVASIRLARACGLAIEVYSADKKDILNALERQKLRIQA